MFNFFKPNAKKLLGEKAESSQAVFQLIKDRQMTDAAVKNLQVKFEELKSKMDPTEAKMVEEGIAMFWKNFNAEPMAVENVAEQHYGGTEVSDENKIETN